MMRDKYTAEERMARFYSGEKIDRVPYMSSATMYAGKLCGLSAEEFYMNPQNSYDVQKLVCRMHQCDGTPCFDFPLGTLIDLGGSLEISSKEMMIPKVIRYPVRNLNEAIDYIVPDVHKGLVFNKEKEFVKISAKDMGNKRVCISAGSPLSTLLSVVEPGMLLRWFYQEPEIVHKLLNQMVDYLVAIADIWIADYGIENCTASACYPAESNNLISPALFEEFALPYILQIHQIFRQKGITEFGVHICGNQNRNLTFYKQLKLGERSFVSIDEQTDIRKAAEVLGKQNIYAGNVPSSYFIGHNVSKVYQYSKGIIGAMKHNEGGFVLMPSCDLPLNALPQNVDAMLQAVRDFGQY